MQQPFLIGMAVTAVLWAICHRRPERKPAWFERPKRASLGAAGPSPPIPPRTPAKALMSHPTPATAAQPPRTVRLPSPAIDAAEASMAAPHATPATAHTMPATTHAMPATTHATPATAPHTMPATPFLLAPLQLEAIAWQGRAWARAEAAAVRAPEIRSDPQNVHDHAVSAFIARLCDSYASEGAAGLDEALAVQECTDAVLTSPDLSATQKMDAITAIDSLGGTHARYNVLGAGLLARVWRRACGSAGAGDLRALVVRQLSDCVEGGRPVCHTGVIAHLCSALQGTEAGAAVGLRPVWALREELLGQASRMRDSGLGAKELEAYAMKTYVDELGMSREIVRGLVDEAVQGYE